MPALPAFGLKPGALDAAHVALVFNKNSKPSGTLALHYAEQRGISPDRLIALDLPESEQLPRPQYESRVAGPIRNWLRDRSLTDQIACLVLFYGVPIRVGPQQVTTEMRVALNRAKRWRREAQREAQELLEDLQGIANSDSRPATTGPATRAANLPKSGEDWQKRFRVELLKAMQRASELRSSVDVAIAKKQVLAAMERALGISGVVASLRPTKRGEKHLREMKLEQMRQLVREKQAEINELLAKGVLAPERRRARELTKNYAGVIGLIHLLEQDIRRLRAKETTASLDSELSTLWAPPTGLHRWRMNTLSARHRANPTLRKALPEEEWQAPILMIARLDGPNPDVVRRIIDDAIATERVGLRGRAYIDARGLAVDRKPGSYGYVDHDLRQLATLLKTRTDIPTVLDNRSELFGLAACPDAALYCGWYSVGRYHDSFLFARGAVAWHIASSEAVSLRDPQRPYWCKSLLADGAAVTMGPVAEPYLSAFPLPRDFFGLLLTGELTLVECYYYTKPYNSWMMLLIGDPLYRPFAVNPQVKLDDFLPEDMRPLKPVPTSQPVR